VKAVVCTRYGPPDVLRLSEVSKPVPKENQILVEIKPVVVKIYPPEKIVDAHRYVEKGHKMGGVAITIGP
jgi:hypothetical protein